MTSVQRILLPLKERKLWNGTREAFANPHVWLRNAEGKTHATRTIQDFFPSLAEPPLAGLLAH